MKQLPAFLCLCLIAFASCTKNLTDATDSSFSATDTKAIPLASAGVVDATTEWYGSYIYYTSTDSTDPNGDPDGQYATMPDDQLISGGTAKVRITDTSLLVYSASVVYDIPYTRDISGDSIVFEGVVRNGANTASMRMEGYQNSAQVFFHVPQNNTTTCDVYVGRSGKTITIKPAIDFTSYKTVQLAVKGNKGYLFVNNKQLTSFPVSTTDRLGEIKQLSLGSDGYLECDRVRLLNSYTKQVRMKEDFNIDGQSHTIYY